MYIRQLWLLATFTDINPTNKRQWVADHSKKALFSAYMNQSKCQRLAQNSLGI